MKCPKCNHPGVTEETCPYQYRHVSERAAPASLDAAAGSAFFVQKLGQLLQMPEREWNENEVLESVRDLLARYQHTMARCQDAAQKYRLGLGGEPVDRLVLDELHRLKQNASDQRTGRADDR